MPWAAGTYSKGNNGTGGWTGDASLGIGIEAGRHDTQDNDFAAGINQCLNKDGSNSCTGDLNLGGFKPVNVAAGTAAAPAICAGGDVNTGIFSAAADQIGIATNGTEKIRIDSSGNIGINTTSPAFALDIYGASTTGILRGFTNDTGAPGFVFNKSRSATVGTNTIVTSGDGLGTITWQGANGTSYTSAASISAFVDGTPGASNDMPGRLVFSTTADGAGSPTERMRITEAGRVGVNNTGFSGAQFGVTSSTASRAAGRFYQSASSDDATPALFLDKQSTTNTTSQVFLQCTINAQATASGQINANGVSQLAFGSWSDERLKENIKDLPSQLANMLALRPVEFDYKDGSGHQIGFIAQEVQVVYPDLVGIGHNEMLTLSGLGKNEARMIKAFQEFAQLMQTKVEALEARIAELEA